MAFTRDDICNTARQFVGCRFRHQGRNENGVDCVGLLVVVARAVGYEHITDVEAYRRTPSANTIRETLAANCDEIPLEDVRRGDILLMRMGGRKPRHAGILLSDGDDPLFIHAVTPAVRIQPISDFPASWFVAGFRMRGLID